MNDWIENNGVKPDVGDANYEVRLRDGEAIPSADEHGYAWLDWTLEDDSGDIVEWRFMSAHKPYPRTVKSDNLFAKGLSQGEVQQLLHILRVQLDTVSLYKEMSKEDAAELWSECDKSDKFTSGTFASFSATHTAYKYHRAEEKKLVSLITKLKGLR